MQVAHQGRSNTQVLHAVGARLVADTCQCGKKPLINLPHHEVVPRGSFSWIPLLCESGGTVFQLEAIAWSFVVVEHGVEQIVLAVVSQRLKQVAVAHITCSESVAMGCNVSDQRGKHLVFVVAADTEEKG